MPVSAHTECPKEAESGAVLPIEMNLHAERLRLAQQLHDGLCQTLSAAQILAALIARKAAECESGESDEKILVGMIAAAVGEMQSIVRQLRSSEPTSRE